VFENLDNVDKYGPSMGQLLDPNFPSTGAHKGAHPELMVPTPGKPPTIRQKSDLARLDRFFVF
jgi:hypothetical protein